VIPPICGGAFTQIIHTKFHVLWFEIERVVTARGGQSRPAKHERPSAASLNFVGSQTYLDPQYFDPQDLDGLFRWR